MKVSLARGTYIVAVSGGIDSVVLLDLLASKSDLKLIVAHFDHGIRHDSHEDAAFVAALAQCYGLPFETQRKELGADASENTARQHRYEFLRKLAEVHSTDGIVTAHHQDDRIETAAINTLRGTRRKGLVFLRTTDELKRPLLGVSKAQIRDYAVANQLEWQEDSTNASMNYLRNRVRARLYERLTPALRAKLLTLLETIEKDNIEIDAGIDRLLEGRGNQLLRSEFEEIDALVLFELVAEWLRRHEAVFDKNTIVRICNGVRSLQTGAKIDVDKQYYCLLTKAHVVLARR